MSTRAYVWFTDANQTVGVYKHYDGYPDTKHGMLAAIASASKLAWPPPRFEADEYAAAFVATAKQEPGCVRLLPEPPDDVKWTYRVSLRNGNALRVEIYDGPIANSELSTTKPIRIELLVND